MGLLVAGTTGYLGTRLVPRLVAAGHAVRCPARLAGDDRRSLKGTVPGQSVGAESRGGTGEMLRAVD